MSSPGAARSTDAAPKLEKPASASSRPVAATQTMFAAGWLQGYFGTASLSVPSFPAATTKRVSRAPAIASASARERPEPPRLTLITLAPARTAYQ